MNIKHTLMALAVTTTVAAGGLGYQTYKLSEADKEIDQLKQKQESHLDLLSRNNVYINKLNNNDAMLRLEMNGLNEAVTTKNNQIKSLKNKLTELTNENNKLKNKKKQMQVVSRGEQLGSSKIINVSATAYTADCKGCIGITKTGKDVRNTVYEGKYRVVAVDPAVIPLHSKLKVETKNDTFYAIAADTGGAIKNSKIDILMETNEKAIQFGRQDVKVTILN